MCGICGEIKFNNSREIIDFESIKYMAEALKHRGPDNEGSFLSTDKKIALYHRRLSIIDLSAAAKQPFFNEDRKICVICNGEIYNFKELKRKLLDNKHKFISKSDSEVIPHLYEEKGMGFLKEIDGMFSIAIWDSNINKLFLIRDRLGKKPLYYQNYGNGLLFSSEVNSLTKHPKSSKDISFEEIYHYLTFLSSGPENTLYKDIKKVKPGYYISVDLDSKIEKKIYWDIPESSGNKYSFDYCKSELSKILSDSIYKRTMSDVDYGVFLSGGVDSSANVALMSERVKDRINTFSVGIKGQKSELEFARIIAKKYNTNHREILLDDGDFINALEILPEIQDEPLSDPVCIPLYYLSKLAKENNIKVVQIGEGSDEIFFGYNHYQSYYKFYKNFWVKFNKLPYVIKKVFLNSSNKFLTIEKKEILRRAFKNQPLFLTGSNAFWEVEKRKILKDCPDFKNLDSSSIIQDIILGGKKVANNRFDLQMSYIDLKFRLPELILMRVDKIMMANSIEARAPFMDYKLVEFSFKIPFEFKVNNGNGKYILKKVLEGKLPKEIIYREKQGFCGSARNMLTEKIEDYAKSKILKNKFIKEFFKIEEVKNIFQNNTRFRNIKIWNLLNLALWYNKSFE